MKKILIIALSLELLSCGNSKNNPMFVSAQNEDKMKQSISDTSDNPKINVKVNRKYDDNGNLIRFDSTYSYYYESPKYKNGNIRSDSLFKKFKNTFQNDFNDSINKKMEDVFFSDSLFQYDFFNNDFFSKRFELNQKQFEKLFKNLDSLKSQMLIKEYPKGNLKKN